MKWPKFLLLPKPPFSALRRWLPRRLQQHEALFVRRVSGQSMEPYVGPGAVVIARGVFLRLKKYDVVVVRQHGIEKIKRIVQLKDGKMFLVGDNPTKSKDSRHFGWVPVDWVVGKVIWPH